MRRHDADEMRQRSGHRAAVAVGAAVCSGCSQGGALAPRSEYAAQVAGLWWVMLAVATVVYLIVVVLLLATAVRRRWSAGDVARTDTIFILGGGIVLPAVVLLGLLVLNVRTLAVQPTGGELTVDVIGHQYWWELRYPEFTTANELHIPVGRRVRLRLTSRDVTHSFWVPELSGKRDLVPGHVNELVIEAADPGAYRGQCAEFCGLQHANMAVYVIAHPADEYEDWLAEAAGPAPEPDTESERRGREAFLDVGCAACHTVRGIPATGDLGPDLTNFASRRTIGPPPPPTTGGTSAAGSSTRSP